MNSVLNVSNTKSVHIWNDRYVNYPDPIIMPCMHILEYHILSHKYLQFQWQNFKKNIFLKTNNTLEMQESTSFRAVLLN
jgi:hypothetical protein